MSIYSAVFPMGYISPARCSASGDGNGSPKSPGRTASRSRRRLAKETSRAKNASGVRKCGRLAWTTGRLLPSSPASISYGHARHGVKHTDGHCRRLLTGSTLSVAILASTPIPYAG